MSIVPETRQSLILRLPDREDVAAWDEFAEIYQPLVYRLAISKGLQHADAQELVQEVMVSISKAIDRWEPDPADGRKARFRDWLFRIARNLMVNILTRRRYRPLGHGNRDLDSLLHATVEESEQSRVFDLEYQRQLFHLAAEKIRGKVQPNTWLAFWKTAVECRETSDVAAELNLTVGAVHIARSRVFGRLRQEVQRLDRADQSKGTPS